MPHTTIICRKHRNLRHTAAVLVGLLALATSAACSSDGDDDGVASGGGSPTSTATGGETSSSPVDWRALLVQYAECMRDNGIDDHPDPDFNAEDDPYDKGIEKAGIDRDTQEFKAAEKACADVMARINKENGPGGAMNEEGFQNMVDFAECMRDNSVDEYQDPVKDAGGYSIFETKSVVEDPDFDTAYEACHNLAPMQLPDDVDEYHEDE